MLVFNHLMISNMKKIYNLFISVALLTFMSCNDSDFLKEEPKYFYTTDNAFSTSGQVDQVLVACYSQIRNIYCNESGNSIVGHGNGTDMFDVPTIRRGSRFNDYGILNSENGTFYSIYSQWYQLIYKANLALYAAELPQITWSSAADKAYAAAQARFFRAWAYRNLGELFGGVPIVKEITTVPRYDYKRATRVETYQFAIDELEAILNDLPETTKTPGRLVRGAAQHTLCQLYIDKGLAIENGEAGDAQAAYKKAIEYGNAVIDGSNYSLMTQRFGTRSTENPVYYYANSTADQTSDHTYLKAGVNIEGNVIWDLFQEGNQNYQEGNKEAIWVAQIDYAANKTEDGSSVLPYSRMYGPVFRDPMSKVCTGTLEDVGGRGICEMTPTMYTRDIVYEGKYATDLRNSDAAFRRTFVGNVKGNEYYGKVIPWSVLYRDGQSSDAVDVAKTQVYPVSCKIATDKYTGLADGQNRSNLYRDEYLIRLPETILLRAEAKMRSGDKAGAAADINLLRSRAQCSYKVTADDVNVDLILDERARELVYEESRWNTLLRMGGTVAVDRIKKYAYWDDPRTTLTTNFNLWPIPQTIIDTNKDEKIEQNPGW
jgi:hypothetical protein